MQNIYDYNYTVWLNNYFYFLNNLYNHFQQRLIYHSVRTGVSTDKLFDHCNSNTFFQFIYNTTRV